MFILQFCLEHATWNQPHTNTHYVVDCCWELCKCKVSHSVSYPNLMYGNIKFTSWHIKWNTSEKSRRHVHIHSWWHLQTILVRQGPQRAPQKRFPLSLSHCLNLASIWKQVIKPTWFFGVLGWPGSLELCCLHHSLISPVANWHSLLLTWIHECIFTIYYYLQHGYHSSKKRKEQQQLFVGHFQRYTLQNLYLRLV